jgi:hypothetical protein
MLGRLLPREGGFFDLFNSQAEQVVLAARELSALVEDFASREERARAIDDAEHAADRITAEALRTLHQTFITPLDRDQIHKLVTTLDDICDLIQDASESLTLYDLRRVTPEMADLSGIALKCCERVKDVVALVGQSVGVDALMRTCAEIDRLESDADRVLRRAMARLFREEQDARELVKVKAIYEQLEEITDRCEDVANLAEGVALEDSWGRFKPGS